MEVPGMCPPQGLVSGLVREWKMVRVGSPVEPETSHRELSCMM